jgi:hypothetical protein
MARLESFRRDWIGATSALHGRQSRAIGHNTALVSQWAAGDAARPVAVRYHSTNVVTYRPDGWVVIRSGGWETVTTSNRLAQAMPDGWRIGSHRTGKASAWWLYRDGRPVLPFASNLAVNTDTGAVGMANSGDAVGILLTADDIAAIVAAEDAARAAREAKRAARILA